MPSQTKRIRLNRLPNVNPEGSLFSQCFDAVQEAGKWYWKTGNGLNIVAKQGDDGIYNDMWGDIGCMEEHYTDSLFNSFIFAGNISSGGGGRQIYAYRPFQTPKIFSLTPQNYYNGGDIDDMRKDIYGHILMLRGGYIDRIILGTASQAGSTILIDIKDASDYKNWSAMGVDVGDLIVNLHDWSTATVTSITTNTYTNDTLNFSAGLSDGGSFATGEHYAVFTRNWYHTSFGTLGLLVPYQNQIETFADMTIFPTLTGYLAKYSTETGSDLNQTWKQLPRFHRFSCMSGNNGYLLIGTQNINNDTGKLLLWDTFSDGYNSEIELDGIVTSIKPYLTGWVVSCNGREYYTDGYSLKELFDWGAGQRSFGTVLTSPKCNAKVVRDGFIYMTVEGSEFRNETGGVLKYSFKTGEWSISPFTYLPVNTGGYISSVKAPVTMADDAAVGTVSWSNVDNAKLEDETFADAVFAGSAVIPKDFLVKLLVGGVVTGQNRGNDANLSTSNIFYNYGHDSTLWQCLLTPAIINASNFGVVLQHRSNTVYTHYLKASNFGFSIPTGAKISGVKVRVKQKYSAGGGNETVWVDYIEITVYYLTYLKVSEEYSQFGSEFFLYYANKFGKMFAGGVNYLLYEYSRSYPYNSNCIAISPAIQFPREVSIKRIHIHLAPTDSPLTDFQGIAKLEVKVADANQKIFRYGFASAVLAINKMRFDGTLTNYNIADVGDEVYISGDNAIAGGQRVHITQIDNAGQSNEEWTFDRNFKDLPVGTPTIQIRPFKSLGSITIPATSVSMKTRKYFFDNKDFKLLTDRIYIEVAVNFIYGENPQTIRVAALEVEYAEAERT